MKYVWLAVLGSVALLGGAFAFEHLGGLAPCKMCIWQRWPHAIAIVLGLVTAFTGWRILAWLAALTLSIGAGIALYHTGVEKKWWEGPNTCTSGSTQGLDTEALLDQILAAPVVRCDEVAWQFLTLSMASWNGILSLILVALWIKAATTSYFPKYPKS